MSAAWTWGTAPMASATMVESGLDRIGVRLGPDPHGADLGRVDPGACHGIARRLDGHGDHVLVQAGDGFLLDRQTGVTAAAPDAGHLLGRQAVARHVCPVADDADRTGRFQ